MTAKGTAAGEDAETARALIRAGRLDEAELLCRRILKADPNDGDCLHQLGKVLGLQGRPELAETALRLAAHHLPDRAEIEFNLGRTLYHLGRGAEAAAHYRSALRLDPKLTAARLDLALVKLPIIYRDAGHVARARAGYRRALRHLAGADLPVAPGDEQAAGTIPPFYLAYQGRNDRDLQALHGGLMHRIMAAAFPDWTRPPEVAAPAPGEPIRIGILSAYFHYHSNWKVPVQGWMQALDRQRYRLHGYHIGRIRDAVTEEAAALCQRFVTGPKTLAQWAETIRADRLHVLLIPGIGMDTPTGKLAALRLAPVQATGYGHPETTGLPTIDHFLSSALMEPADAEAHYTETLIRLPGLGLWYTPPAVTPAPVGRDGLGLAEGDIAYWCCQGLYKYLPQYDWIFPAVAAALPRARFLFIRYPHGDAVTEVFRTRLAVAFAARGLDAETHCRFLPFMGREDFAGATRAADIFLDSVGWSGFNSALEAIEADLPVVAMAGTLMRGRHAAAILARMGLPDLIARTPEALVDLAVALGRDAGLRHGFSARIAETKHRLLREPAVKERLEAYLDRAAGSIGQDRVAIA